MVEVFLLIIFITLFFIFLINSIFSHRTTDKNQTTDYKIPTSYPLIGHMIAFYKHKNDSFEWLSNLIISSPTSTFTIDRLFGVRNIMTADPKVVEHILKTNFPIYQKGPYQKDVLRDLLNDGIFNADDHTWKFQRQVASYEFNTKSLRKFVETVVDTELNDRLIPILTEAANNKTVLDLQDILQRFAFDNVCKIAFGYDPQYLSPSLPQSKFAIAFEDAVMISSKRFRTYFPILWKIRRFFNIGSEKKLKEAVHEIREFANFLVKQKKKENSSHETQDLLSRFLKSGHNDEKFITDIVISFILAGRDTTSSALTWFFWLLHKNKNVEEEIVKEIKNKGNQSSKTEQHSSVFEEVKDMMYIHAALSESMRLYPPVAADSKEAVANDVLPNGIHVKKGTRVTYHPYAMGRVEKIWGPDWAQYRPERWLEIMEENEEGKKWKYVGRDPYSYPVFQAGPRVCLGKEMAYLQMKRVVAGVLERFKVVPAVEEGFEPVYLPYLTAKMEDGLPVRIELRNEVM